MDRSDKLDYTTEWEDPELDAIIETRCEEERPQGGSLGLQSLGPRAPFLARVFDVPPGRNGGFFWITDIGLLASDPLAYLTRVALVAGLIYLVNLATKLL